MSPISSHHAIDKHTEPGQTERAFSLNLGVQTLVWQRHTRVFACFPLHILILESNTLLRVMITFSGLAGSTPMSRDNSSSRVFILCLGLLLDYNDTALRLYSLTFMSPCLSALPNRSNKASLLAGSKNQVFCNNVSKRGLTILIFSN